MLFSGIILLTDCYFVLIYRCSHDVVIKARCNGFKIKEGRFRLERMKNSLLWGWCHWNRLHMKVVDDPSLEVFKARLGRVLSNLIPFSENSPVKNQMKLWGCRYKSKKRKCSFTQHAGKVWNSSPEAPVEAICVNVFEKLLDKSMEEESIKDADAAFN